jgi:hypothetical protein
MAPPAAPSYAAAPMRPPTVDPATAPRAASSKTTYVFFIVLLAVVVGVVIIALASCGHAPPPPPKPAEKPISAIADIAGKWTASDDMDFAYSLTITPEGALDLWIDRNHMGRCEEKGTLSPPADKTFQLTYRINDCHREAKGSTQALAVESFTGDTLTISLGAERHVYRRAP